MVVSVSSRSEEGRVGATCTTPPLWSSGSVRVTGCQHSVARQEELVRDGEVSPATLTEKVRVSPHMCEVQFSTPDSHNSHDT